LGAEFAGLLVVQRVHDGGEPQDVGQQDELLPDRRAGLADLREIADAGQPFLGREVHLAGEGVQVTDRGLHDLLEARVRRVRHLRQRGVRRRVLVEILHGVPPVLRRGR